MTDAPEVKVRQMPKGGRKGGSVFPRLTLTDAIVYARKLVSKTHTAPQPDEIIRTGVCGSKGGTGAVRMSALKQYGFLKGDAKTNYSADELAKKIVAAPPEELVLLYRQAMLKPTVFRKLFDTFHGDSVTKAKLKQRIADLKVHPDETATCVDLYVSGMVTAELVTVEGDQVKHLAQSDIAVVPATIEAVNVDQDATDSELSGETENGGDEGGDIVPDGTEAEKEVANAKVLNGAVQPRPQAVFNVNVTLDSSLDIEKLQKQLELLKRFGAI